MNTHDKNIDEMTMEVMTHKEKENIFLDTEEKSLLLSSKAKESTAAALAKLDAVKGNSWHPWRKSLTSYRMCDTGQRSRLKHCFSSS